MKVDPSIKDTVTKREIKKFDKAFATRAKELREERGLKRGWVADRLGVHYNTLKNWELGNSHPGSRELLGLCKIYHIDPSEFFRSI